ncbi:PfkB family carbohydrate kinase [Treponema brennaborense]|uniref:PfkB domain protein n=1 Tax=Treponema brennaborense (strain DSM 12168 / CIP 105900 / DD5/3) TaxID=906968 RepID=F4LK15_TREBD|nr:PfkB family carbohydrate kinase [Treponema brennaborense]AEE17477.1 PfkB domain protein [Treponema brennaborense DSM 12168]
MKQTLVIGSTVVDVIVAIPHLPSTGEDINVTAQTQRLGGCAYNVSNMLRLTGTPYTLCSPVGSGLYGDFVAERLAQLGIPCFIRLENVPNGCCYCIVENDGERTFLSQHGAEYVFSRSWMHRIDSESADSVYICGLEIEEPTGSEIILYLEEHPEYTVFFAPGPRISSIPQERLNRIFALHPVLHLNDTEAVGFTKRAAVSEAAAALYEKTGNAVVITQGKDGAFCMDRGRGFSVPGFPAEVADTIGAGDAHAGSVIAYLKQGFSLEESVRRANRIAAAVVSVNGATLPDGQYAATVQNFVPAL